MTEKLEKILANVEKPGRYTGGEFGSVVKDADAISLRYAFCFPDTYEIGMSHLGMKILYSLVNAREDAWCERVYAPWVDMEREMRAQGVPLYALESGDPLDRFDIIGFTLQYELSYTNVLNMLDLAGLPVRAADRDFPMPLIIAGGPCACNPEPLADFIDLFLPGEGEEVTDDVLDLLKIHKKKGSTKREFLREATKIKGVYVPSLYDVGYNVDGTIASITPIDGAPERVEKRVVDNLDTCFFPEKIVVPFLEPVHDRVTAEVFRGCIRGCRFCQAGFLYRPVREKSPEVVNDQARQLCAATGYDEISLCSLSTSDYTRLEPLIEGMLEWTDSDKINIALPSLRADNFPQELAAKLTGVRRSSLTFAPEAGTARLRDVINKNLAEHEILDAACKAFSGGWTAVKLYFMMGLPTESDEDIEGIAALSQKVVDEYYRNPDKPKGKGVTVSLGVANFVPKPFTPFQWEPQDSMDTMREKQRYLISKITTRKINVSFHKPETSFLEAVFALGDRRLCEVIYTAWRDGCRFDGWDDCFKFNTWMSAFERCGVSPEFYANRRKSYDEILPWSVMDYGVSRAFLERENVKAHAGEATPNCREKCAGCGVTECALRGRAE